MKKLMIAAAIVCAAALSQAATFDWTSTKTLLQGDASTYSEGRVSDMSNKLANYLKVVAPIDYTLEIWSMKDDGSGKLVKDKIVGTKTDKLAASNFGTTSKISYGDLVITLSPDIAQGGDFYAEATLSYSDGKYNYTKTGTFQDKISGAGNTGIAMVFETGWAAEAVLEPTSGLLLLLGVAGLALKRHRA